MNKQDYLARLREGLSGLPQDDIEERLDFYSEMIDDKVEDGLTEEEALAEIGPADEVISQIIADTPLTRLVRERIKPRRRLQVWEIVLLLLGFPLWFPLLMAALAVLLSVYAVLWAVIISLWAVEAALAVGALGAAAAGVLYICKGRVLQGIALISAAMVLAGLAVFLFFGCKWAAKGIIMLTKKIALGVKTLFLRKEAK